jgi:serine/threonine protein kinase
MSSSSFLRETAQPEVICFVCNSTQGTRSKPRNSVRRCTDEVCIPPGLGSDTSRHPSPALRDIAKESVPVRTVARIGAQAARALAVAHKAGIVHRDIKPENIMMRDDGYVKVLDVGIARLAVHLRAHRSLRSQRTRTSLNAKNQSSHRATADRNDSSVLQNRHCAHGENAIIS